MPVEPTVVPGCVVLPLALACDDRGEFVKIYQRSIFQAAGLEPGVAEVFVSRSGRGVIRGLHFQVPPHAHAKTVVCLRGEVFDVVVDLRIGSPTFGDHVTFELDAAAPAAVHVPIGCAHGFQALTEEASVAYIVSTEYAPQHDTGVRWDTAGVRWPLTDPVLSPRDRSFEPLSAFDSPFRYAPALR